MARMEEINEELLRDEYLFSKYCVTYVDLVRNLTFTSLYNPLYDVLEYKILNPTKYYQIDENDKDKLYYLDYVAFNSYSNYNLTYWIYLANQITDTVDTIEYDYFILVDPEKINELAYQTARIITEKVYSVLPELDLNEINILNYLDIYKFGSVSGIINIFLNYDFSTVADTDVYNLIHSLI